MKVKLTTGIATADESWEPGKVVDIDNDWAKRLLESGQAEPVAVKPSQRAEKRGPKNHEER